MSMRARATLVTAAFLVLLMLTLVVMWLAIQGRYLRAEQYARVRIVTYLIAEVSEDSLLEGNTLRLAQVVDDIAAENAMDRILIADRTGAVQVDSDHRAYNETPVLMERALRNDSEIIVTRPGHWWSAVAARNDVGQELGAVMVRYSTESLVSAQRRSRALGLALAIASIVIGSALAYFAARLITRPLEVLLAGIRRMQTGDAVASVAVTGAPEFTEIGQAFNEMSSVVSERVRRLELLNRLAAELPPAGDLREIASILRRYTWPMMGARSYLWAIDPLSRTLVPVPSDEGERMGEPVAVSPESVVGRAFMQRRMIVIGGEGQELPPGSAIAAGIPVRSALVLPLSTHDSISGVMALSFPSERWTGKEDIAMAWAVVNVAAPAVTARLRADTQGRAAAALQSLLVPSELPDMGLDVAAEYRPAEELAGLGGDYYDLVRLADSRWCIIVGDTSGKGLEAAQHTATAKYVIRSYILEYSGPAEALYWSNRALALQEQADSFITVFCGVLDASSGWMTYASAGHTPPLIFRRAAGQVEPLPTRGMALGIRRLEVYEEQAVHLAPGDVFCAFTDGITEARRDGEWFGDTRLQEVLSSCADLPARDICAAIVREVREFTGEALKDDVVLVVIKMP